MTEKCQYCGGELEYICLPKTVEVGKESSDYATIRICKRCSRFYEPDADKEVLPVVDDS